MKLYLAGAKPYLKKYFPYAKSQRILLTYFDIDKSTMNTVEEQGIYELFMDCGAYSAWTQGKPINVHDYGKFIQNHKHLIEVYPNLDVKGSVEQTEQNQRILEEEYGLTPIPVFHVKTQRWDIAERYIDKYEYIALGAIAGEGIPAELLYYNLDNVFSRAKKDPITKFHGFGLTIKRFLERYPFYSVDSTSWLGGLRFGTLPGSNLIDKMYLKKRDIRRNVFTGIEKYVNLEKYITDLWKTRGITWNQ